MAPLVLSWYCSAVSPDRKTALPVTDMQVNRALAFRLLAIARSPMLPPQPTLEPSGDEDCQIDCWSLCENSCGGRGKLTRSLLLYSARVNGLTSGPTFNCTAALPALNSDASPVIAGFSANWRTTPRLSTGAVVGISKVPVRSDWPSAMPPAVRPAAPPRMLLYLS